MKRFVLALIVTVSAPAMAQFAVDGSIGVTAPVGHSTGLNAGLDLMGAFEWRPLPVVPFALRGEVGWDHLNYNGPFVAAQDLTRFVVDGIVDIPLPAVRIRPYALAGVGIYHGSVLGSGRTDPGLNIGGGVRYPFGPLDGFFEVRYHIVYFPASEEFIPFQFGVRFPF
jgi:hypothetical protein